MNLFIFSRPEISAEEERFYTAQKFGVGRHYVLKLAVLRADFAHDDLTLIFKNLRLNLARMLVHQSFKRSLAGNDGTANFLDAARAKRIGLARKAQWRA